MFSYRLLLFNHTRRGGRGGNLLQLRCRQQQDFSTSQEAMSRKLNAYLKALFKKLLFFVHPDLLVGFSKEQRVNATNIQLLGGYLDDLEKGSVVAANSSNSSIRSLTFYLKPGAGVDRSDSSTPKRVQISTKQIQQSLHELLDLLGVKELPPSPFQGTAGGEGVGVGGERRWHSSFVSSKPEVVNAFLDSLLDRRDLLAMRAEQSGHFQQLVAVTKNTLGVQKIEMRYSWSSQNNYVLFSKILGLVQDAGHSLNLPWKGMDLVLTLDDCSLKPVDAVEGHVIINPSNVPLQWLEALQAVSPKVLLEAQHYKRNLAMLQKEAEKRLGRTLRLALLEHVGEQGATKLNLARAISVKIRKGFTCSRLWYMSLLQSMTDEEEEVDEPLVAAEVEVEEVVVEEERDGDVVNLELERHQSLLLTESKSDVPERSLITTSSLHWLQLLPLRVEIVIEEGYGSKPLENGDLRLDCRCARELWKSLLVEQALELVVKKARSKQMQIKIAELCTKVTLDLSLASLGKAKGLDDELYEAFLKTMSSHLQQKQLKNLKLAALAHHHVLVGRYLALSDDGCVVMPHDLRP